MRPGRATITAACGALAVVAGLLWWQSAFGVKSLPSRGPQADATGAEEPDATRETGTLKSEGKLRQAAVDSGRQQLATPVPETTEGSLLLFVVYGDDRSPAAGIGVVVQEVLGQGPRAAPRRFTTSAKGSVRVAGLRPGKVHVRTDRQATKGKTTTVVAGEETRFTLTLEEGIDVHGVVVDTDGIPVADAEIILAGWAALEPHVAGRSDDQGRFLLRQVPQHANLGARALGHAPSPLHTITAAAGAKVEIRIVLPGAGGGVNGRVLDPDGIGMAGTLVKMGLLERDLSVLNLPDGSRGMKPRAAETRTDAEGKFEVFGLASGKTPVLARADGFAPWLGSVDVVAHGTTQMVIRLQRGVTCEGTAYDESGQPAGRVEVNHGAYGAPHRRSTRTRDDGTYRLEGLPTGAILVQARGKDRGNASVELNGLPGQVLRWDPRLSRGRQLEIVVMDQRNNPLPRVGVVSIGPVSKAKGQRPWFYFGVTDKDGRCVLIDCPAAPLRVLELRKQEYATLRRFDVDPGVGRIVLRMEHEGKPTARIVGILLDPDGKPVAGAELNPIRLKDGRARTHATKADGRIDIGELGPGRYQLLIRAPGHPWYRSVERELVNGETWDLGTIQLVRGACVLVHVTNAAEVAKSVRHVYLTVCGTDGTSVANIDTRQAPLRSPPVPKGRYLLHVSGPKVIPQTIPITVKEGEDTEVRTSIAIGVARVFEFVLPEGNDKSHELAVSLVGDGGFRFVRRYSRVRPDSFKLRVGLAPGHYKLEASTNQGHKGHLRLEVSAEPAATGTLRVNLF